MNQCSTCAFCHFNMRIGDWTCDKGYDPRKMVGAELPCLKYESRGSRNKENTMRSEQEIKDKIDELCERLAGVYSDFWMWGVGYGLQDQIKMLDWCLDKSKDEVRNHEVLIMIEHDDCVNNKDGFGDMRGCDESRSKLLALQWVLRIKEKL